MEERSAIWQQDSFRSFHLPIHLRWPPPCRVVMLGFWREGFGRDWTIDLLLMSLRVSVSVLATVVYVFV